MSTTEYVQDGGASAPFSNECDANVGNIRTSKSLPDITFPFTPTLEPMEVDISSISASIGISGFPLDYVDEEVLLPF
jgi:hypothetical protein